MTAQGGVLPDVETLCMFARLVGDEQMRAVADRVMDAMLGGAANYPDGALPGSTWRVMYVCRADGAEEDMGRRDFDSEAEARAYFTSNEVTNRMDRYWRAELRVRPPEPGWRVVEAHPYRGEEQAVPR